MPKAKFLIPLSLIAAILSAQPRTYAVRVNADGTFSPQVVYVKSCDTVRWEGVTRLDSIVSVNGAGGYPAMCTARDPYTASSLTGPPVFAPSGVYTLSPLGRGFSETTAATCPGNARPIFTGDNGKRLCPVAGAYQASLDTTWASQNNTGVFVRLLWSDVNPTPGVYDFAVLQREMDQAIRYGKVFSLGIKAGDDGTPDWIFSTNTNGSARVNGGGGVPRLKLEDFGGSPQTSCGNKLDLGNPTRSTYRQLYFNMLTEVAKFVKSRADWYRALAYIKISGANLISHENRLPKECSVIGTGVSQVTCVCNPGVFAADGYRPSGLYSFYDEQTQLLKTLFPGKPMSYALIQDGFPRVNEAGGYELPNGASSNSTALPDGTDLTREIMDRGQATHGLSYVVQHNGVQPKPTGCNFEGLHPKPNVSYLSFWAVGSGCPNRWAVKEGAEGQLTGFQTLNRDGVSTREELDLTFQNTWDNSDGMFLEIYEDMFWLAENTARGILPRSGKTIGQWADQFHQRRNDPVFPNFIAAKNPFPITHSVLINRTNAGTAAQTLTYIHGMKCGLGRQEWGQIVIDAQLPAIASGGVLSAGGFGAFPAVAPGSWIEIYGTGLSTTSREWTGADFSGLNAPVSLDGVSVRIGGQAAYINYVSPGQINAQVPSNAPLGTQPLTVSTAIGTSAAANVAVNATQPGLNAPALFRVNGRQYAAALFPDNITFALPVSAIAGVRSRPARVGETITLYGVGFGPVTPAIAAGQVVQGSNMLSAPLQVFFGGVRATVTYAGLAPGAVGLYQFNVVVPAVAAGDAVPLTFTLGGTGGTQILFTSVAN